MCLLTISFQTASHSMQSVHTARAHTVCTATLRYFGIKYRHILYIITVSKSSPIRSSRCGCASRWHPNRRHILQDQDAIDGRRACIAPNLNSARCTRRSTCRCHRPFGLLHMVAKKTAPLKMIHEVNYFQTLGIGAGDGALPPAHDGR